MTPPDDLGLDAAERGVSLHPVQDRGALGAVLWDMDGLLVDSEPLWTIAEHELFAGWGQEFTSELKLAIMGTRLDVAVPAMIAYAGVDEDPAAVARRLLGRMVELYGRQAPLRPGALTLLRSLAAAGVPQALVSSSFRVLVDAVLAALPGPEPFATSVAGDEVQHSKPHPEPYLRAAAALGVDPARCAVLEDSASGAASGAAAGCAVVVVPSEGPVPEDPRWVLRPSLAQVSFADLAQLIQLAQSSRSGCSATIRS